MRVPIGCPASIWFLMAVKERTWPFELYDPMFVKPS